MFGEGKVKSFDALQGIGFIEIENDKKDIIFHIADFPDSEQPPTVGECLKFKIEEEFGKRKATYIVRVDVHGEDIHPAEIMHEEYDEHTVAPPKVPPSLLSKLIGALAIAIVGLLGYEGFMKYQEYQLTQELKYEQASVQQEHAVEKQSEAVKHLPDVVRLPEREERRVQPLYSQAMLKSE